MSRSSLIPSAEFPTSIQSTFFGAAKKLGASTFWLLLGRLGTHVIAILVSVLIARRLGAEVLGQYAFITSVIFVLNGFTSLGTDVLLLREVAAKNKFTILAPVLLFQVLLSALLAGLVLIAIPFLPRPLISVGPALGLYSLALFPLAVYTVFGAALRGRERMQAYSLVNLFGAFAQLAGIWFLAQPGTDVFFLATVLLAFQFIAALLAIGFAFSLLPAVRKTWHATRLSLISLLKQGAPIAAFGLFATLYQRMSLYLVASTQDPSAAGFFSAALRVVEAPKFLHVALLGALLPTMALVYAKKTLSKKTQAQAKVFTLSFWGLLFVSTLASIVLSFFAESIAIRLFGVRFRSAGEILKILSLNLIPFTVSQYLGVRMLASGKEKLIIFPVAVGLVSLIVLSLWLIPGSGSIGAAWAAVISESLLALAFIAFMRVKI